MKSLGTLIRLAKFTLDEKRRVLADLEASRARLLATIQALSDELLGEQVVAGTQTSVAHAYNTYAQATMAKRQTLQQSLEQLDVQIVLARDEVQNAYGELKKYETSAQLIEQRALKAAAAKAQAQLDEAGLTTHLRQDEQP